MGQVIPFPSRLLDVPSHQRQELRGLLDNLRADVRHLEAALSLAADALAAEPDPAALRAEVIALSAQVIDMACSLDRLGHALPVCDVSVAARALIELIFELERVERRGHSALLSALLYCPAVFGLSGSATDCSGAPEHI